MEIRVLWTDKHFVYSLWKNMQLPQPLWHVTYYDWIWECALSTHGWSVPVDCYIYYIKLERETKDVLRWEKKLVT